LVPLPQLHKKGELLRNTQGGRREGGKGARAFPTFILKKKSGLGEEKPRRLALAGSRVKCRRKRCLGLISGAKGRKKKKRNGATSKCGRKRPRFTSPSKTQSCSKKREYLSTLLFITSGSQKGKGKEREGEKGPSSCVLRLKKRPFPLPAAPWIEKKNCSTLTQYDEREKWKGRKKRE